MRRIILVDSVTLLQYVFCITRQVREQGWEKSWPFVFQVYFPAACLSRPPSNIAIGTTGMALDEATMAEIKHLYLADALTLAEIGSRYGRTASGISRLARTHGWVMRSQLRGYAPRNCVPSTPKARELLVARICDVIGTKLKQMEAQMQSGELSTEDFERDANSVASMVGSVDKATGSDGEEKRKPKSAAPTNSAADDAERLHREIIERFERIQKRRNAEAGSE